ncbi:MAG: CotH kinase family protein [Dysgonomonas sp.]|nr:CotH kinase family protein [Dysgonomonas sp.]
MKKLVAIILFFATLCFCSCSDDKEDVNLKLSESSIKVGASSSKVKLTVSSTEKWDASLSDTWISVSPISGNAGDTEVEITVSDNLTGEKRATSLVFVAGNKTAKVQLDQDLQQIFKIPAMNFTVNNGGCVVPVVSDKEYEAIVPEDINWITFSKVNGVLQMTVEENKTESERLVKISFKEAGSQEIIETLIIQNSTTSTSNLLKLQQIKIDNIPCVIDQGTLQIYFPVDLDKAPQLSHKLDFEGLGIEYLKIEDQKIYSGDNFTFSNFASRSQFHIQIGNDLITETKNSVLNITGLPIVSIFAPEGIVDEPKRPCDMIFIDPKGRTNGDKIYFESFAGIEWRGSGALRYDKKAYGFKLRDRSTGESIDAELLGLRDDNNWILDAMWLDNAKMRNRVCFDTWNEFNELYYKKNGDEKKAASGTHGHLVEVFLDGIYNGMYVLSDKLDRKQLKLKKDGGYLYKLGDWTDECIMQGYTSAYDNNKLEWNGVEMDYPDEIGLVEFKYYSDLLDFVTKTSKEEFSAQFEERIDIDNMIDCFLFTNLIMGYDNIGRNTFWGIYNIKKSTKMIPLIWDLDGTLGRTWDGNEEDPNSGWMVNNRHNGKAYKIYERIINENPAGIHSRIKARWTAIRANILTAEKMNEKLDFYANQQINSGAEKREMVRWNTGYKNITTEVAYIKNWYAKRLLKIDQLVNDL